jgi:hypothetical protein
VPVFLFLRIYFHTIWKLLYIIPTISHSEVKWKIWREKWQNYPINIHIQCCKCFLLTKAVSEWKHLQKCTIIHCKASTTWCQEEQNVFQKAMKLHNKVNLVNGVRKLCISQLHLSWPCRHFILVTLLEILFTTFIKIPTYFLHKHAGVYIYAPLKMMGFNNKTRKRIKRDIYYCAISI